MAVTKINFECEESLRDAFLAAINVAGFTTMSEAFREYMRNVVNINSLPSKVNSISNHSCGCQGEKQK
jgi:hypothetical protein